MGLGKLYGQNKGGMSINGIIKDYYAYAGENVKAGDLVEYVNGIAGKMDYGTSENTAIDNTNANTGYAISAAQLDDSRVFIAHSYSSNYNLHGMVVSINGADITTGQDIELSAEKNSGAVISVVVLDNSRVFIAHSYSSNYNLYGMVCTVDGTKIEVNSTRNFINGVAYCGKTISTQLLSNGNIFIAHSYSDSYYLYGIVATVSEDNTISAGSDTPLVKTSNAGYAISTSILSNGNIFIAHSYGSSYYLYGIVCAVSDTTITYGTDTSIYSTAYTGYRISSQALSDNRVFIAHSYKSSTNYYLRARVVSVDDTTIAIGTLTVLSSETGTGNAISTVLLPSGNVLVIHSHTKSSFYLYGIVCAIEGTTIAAGADTQLNSTTYTGYVTSPLLLKSGAIFIAHSNSSSYYLDAQIFGIDENNIPTNSISTTEYETQVRKVTTGQFHGVAKTSGTGGDSSGHNDLVSIYTLDENEIPNGTQEFAMADGNTLVDANGDVFMVKEE